MHRLALSLTSALAALMFLEALLTAPAAQPRPTPPDPLASGATLGLNQAWYVHQGYTEWGAAPAPIAPARFPTPIPTVRNAMHTAFDHQAFLPLVHRTSSITEARALWVTRWDYSTVTDVETLVANAAGAGFNTLLFQVRGTADAFYTPGLEPWGARLAGGLGQDPGWDPLQTAVASAHAHDLELHAYLNVYPVWLRSEHGTPPRTTARPEHLFWSLSYDHDPWHAWRCTNVSGTWMSLVGSGYLWATPALTDVVDRVVSVSEDLVSRYDVDGIHLDLVRYPGRDYSYDPFSNAGYAAARADDEDLSRAEWQRQQVTGLVSRVYGDVILPRSDLRLSAAVWPVYQDLWQWGYKQGYSDYYQDSQAWTRSGMIDAVMPMLYSSNVLSYPDVLTPTQFSLSAADFLAHSGGRHVFPGISAQYADFAEIAQRIAIVRDLGAPGHAIFSARLVAVNDYWDEFAAGPYASPAAPPFMPWRP